MTTYRNELSTESLPRPQSDEGRADHTSHVLAVSLAESLRHAEIIDKALADPAVRDALSEFKRHNDRATYWHSRRVTELVVAAGVRLHMSDRDILTGAKGALTHDIGKSKTHIHQAIKTPATFAEQPELLPAIKQHPAEGVALAYWHGLDVNVRKIIGLHHSLQTIRPAYGTPDTLQAVPEADGFKPDVAQLVGLVAVADVWDALTLDAQGAREYLRGKPCGPGEAQRTIASLRTSDEVKQALLGVVRVNTDLD